MAQLNKKVLTGTYAQAVVHAPAVGTKSEDQIKFYLNQPTFEGSKIRVMPDVHLGRGTVVGFTATVTDCIMPSLIGGDIGCGVSAWCLGKTRIKPDKLDRFIRKNIPAGPGKSREIRYEKLDSLFPGTQNGEDFEQKIKRLCKKTLMYELHVWNSLGTLGGGNHFIEVDRDEEKNFWLILHSGSRNFGLQVTGYHERAAAQKSGKEIRLPFLTGDGAAEYLDDMQTAVEYARINRQIMGHQIISSFFKMDPGSCEQIESIHNYIDIKEGIIRKGAVAAAPGKKVIIPLSMADGAIIGMGKSGVEWNLSAPHGLGRKMSRTKARSSLDLDYFRKVMKQVWSSSIGKETLDESPMAYKKSSAIFPYLEHVLDISHRLKPVYNFKAGG